MPLNKYPNVYSPFQVGGMTLKNRIQYSPIVSNHADQITGGVTRELLDFVAAQAGTGAALVTIGSTPVNFAEARDFHGCLSATRDTDVAGLTMLAREAHRHDCKLSAELIHGGQWGAMTLPEGSRAWVPSVIEPYHDPGRVREITRAEMLDVIDDFTACIKRCIAASFDMVMIHCAHGNLLSAFLSTMWNQRRDAYGGNEENRWRFPLALLEAARDAAGGKIPIELRIAGNEHMPGGTPLDERIRFIREAERYVDMVVVSAGNLMYGEAASYNMPGYYIPEGVNVPYAAAIKEACPEIAVSVCGGIATLEHAEEIIKSGAADVVAMAKALMADGELVVKGARGRERDIRPCMRCLYCLKKNNNDTHLSGCAVNPTLGWEYRTAPPALAPRKKRAMIIGGGPGGMAAARYLTRRGHEVVLYEQTDKLGGRLPEASALSFKEGFRRYFEYAVRKTHECGAKIVLGTRADEDTVRAESPDVLIIAVGAAASRLFDASADAGRELVRRTIPRPHAEASQNADLSAPASVNVLDVSDIDRIDAEIGESVVVCGAGLSGTECALALAMRGKDVTLVDKLPLDLFYGDASMFHKPTIARLLKEYNVTMLPECTVRAFTADGLLPREALRK